MKKILFLLIFILAGITANAQKWYVATTGSDTHGKGTLADPWASVNHAADTIYGAAFYGDTIFVLAGTYTEIDSISFSTGVSLVGQGSASTINFTFSDSTFSDACLQFVSTTEGTAGNQSISNLKITGSNQTAYHGIYVKNRSNVILSNLIVEDFRYNGINIRGQNTTETEPTAYATGNKIINCTITNCSKKPYYFSSAGNGQVRISGQDGIIISNNVLTNITAGAGFCANNIDATYGYNKNMDIYGNKSYKPTGNGTDWNIHFETWDGMGGNRIYDNEFWGGGMQLDIAGHFNVKGDAEYSWLIKDNLFANTTQLAHLAGEDANNGIIVEGDTKDVIISKNHFKYVGAGIKMYPNEYTKPARYYDIENVEISYNIFENIGYTNENSYVIELYTNDDSVYIKNIKIDNNVIVGNSSYKAEAGLFMYMACPQEDIYFRNNIVVGMVIAPIVFYYNTGTLINFYTQNNCLYSNGYSNNIKSDFSSEIVNHVNTLNIKVDPAFVSTDDFHLQHTSACINTGLDVGLTSDYDGITVPQGSAVDIGAFEYVSLPVPTTGLGWEPVLSKRNFKDDVNLPQSKWMIDAVPVTTTAPEINNLVGTTSGIQGQLDAKAALSAPAFTTSITVTPGDTTVTAVVGKIVYKTSDNHLYVCKQLTAKKWYQLDN